MYSLRLSTADKGVFVHILELIVNDCMLPLMRVAILWSETENNDNFNKVFL